MALFRLGHCVLSSGVPSAWKIECDALSQADWQALALMAAERLPRFGSIEGVPRGGLPFAEALRAHLYRDGPVLIVDDVLTTGASMERQRGTREALGCVVFARGPVPAWITPLFQMPSRRT